MAALPYIQLYPADYLADTAHLNAAQHGAYLLLIMNYWQTGAPLKDSNVRLANVARMSKDEWLEAREMLEEFFEISNGEWVHHRIERDLSGVYSKSKNASMAGKASAEARRIKRLTNASTNVEQKGNHTDTDTDTDTDKKQDQKTLPQPRASTGLGAEFDGIDFTFSDQQLFKWQEAYPKTDVESEIKKAAVWAAANPNKAKKNWARFLNTWIAKVEQAKGPLEGSCPVDKIIDLYHRICPAFSPVAVTTDKALRAAVVERWNESEDHQKSPFWVAFFKKSGNKASVFYRGENCIPRLEALMSRAIFRDIEESA